MKYILLGICSLAVFGVSFTYFTGRIPEGSVPVLRSQSVSTFPVDDNLYTWRNMPEGERVQICGRMVDKGVANVWALNMCDCITGIADDGNSDDTKISDIVARCATLLSQ